MSDSTVWNPLDVLRDKVPNLDPNTVTAALVAVEYFDPEKGEITWSWARNDDVPATRTLGMLRAIQVEIESHYTANGNAFSDGDEA